MSIKSNEIIDKIKNIKPLLKISLIFNIKY